MHVMYIVSFHIHLIIVTAVDLLVLFLILLPSFLNVRLVAISQCIFIVVAGVLNVLAVRAGDR